jgi:hypothetical protein
LPVTATVVSNVTLFGSETARAVRLWRYRFRHQAETWWAGRPRNASGFKAERLRVGSVPSRAV